MKSVRVNIESPKINWSKRALFVSLGNDVIVLSNGNHTSPSFEGTVVFQKNSDYSIGDFSKSWSKELFTPYNDIVQLSND